MTQLERSLREQQIFESYYNRESRKIDHVFACLFVAQWLAGILMALAVSPFTWSGGEKAVHEHVLFAIFLGGAIASLPAYRGWFFAGSPYNRYLNAVAQMFYSTLFIHITGGRIETHFHVFGSLAFLAFYRDSRVLVLATLITMADHVVRGFWWPQSVYGAFNAGLGRALEHGGWVIFEDVVLYFSISNGLKQFRAFCRQQVQLENALTTVEEQVNNRTLELMNAQQKVVEQQQALMHAAKLSALGEMSGGVAHEINNPLAIIKMVASQLEEEIQAPDFNRPLAVEMVKKVITTSDRIGKIVLGLRAFARDGRNDPFAPVKVEDLIRNTVGLCSERFRSGGVELRIGEIPAGLCFEGREVQISQVLLNLLNNAHDAIRNSPEKWVAVSVATAGDSLKITVADAGGGIPPEVQKKLFQPFFTTKEIGKGTGMGLSISHGIVRSHGGTIALDSTAPSTAFVITLPLRQSARAA